MPLVQTDGLLGLHADACIHPVEHVVELELSIFQIEPVAARLAHILNPGQNRACRRCRINPRGHRIRIVVRHGGHGVVDMLRKADDVGALNEPLAIEAARLTDRTGHEARLAILDRARFPVPRDIDQRGDIPVERIVGDQPAGGSRRARRLGRVQRFFPRLLRLHQVRLKFGKYILRLCQRVVEPLQLRLLLDGRRGDEGWRIPGLASAPALGHVIEVREQLVILFLRNRVVLVIVAARAANRHAQEHGTGGVDAIDDVFHRVLLRNDSAFRVAAMIAIEPGGDPLIQRGIRQQVAGELFDRELVVRHVAIERIDHPIAPSPHEPRAVPLIAVAVGIARRFEPRDTPSARHIAATAAVDRPPSRRPLGEVSARKASSSRDVGGRPVRSSVTRRSSVARSAWAEGFKPSRSNRCSTNASIGLRTHFGSLTVGTAGRVGGLNDQCFSQLAPCSIHRRIIAISRSLSGSPASVPF